MGQDNYTMLPNNLLAALVKTPLPAYEFRVFLALCRASLGWRRSWCNKSNREIAEYSGIELRNVVRALKGLERKLMVARRRERDATRYELNLNPASWRIPQPEKRQGVLSLETTPETSPVMSLETTG